MGLPRFLCQKCHNLTARIAPHDSLRFLFSPNGLGRLFAIFVHPRQSEAFVGCARTNESIIDRDHENTFDSDDYCRAARSQSEFEIDGKAS